MKSKIAFLTLYVLALLFAGCKENLLDSPYITVLTPVRDQVFQDKDSINVKAQIEPRNTSVTHSTITIKDKKGHVLSSTNIGCACDDLPVVKLEHSFWYPVKNKKEVTLEICADLKNGETICETIPFVITN